MNLSGNDLICLQKNTGRRRRSSRANELARLGTPDKSIQIIHQRLEHGRNPRASCLPVPFMSDNHQGCGLVQHSCDEHVNHQDDDPAIGRTANLIDCVVLVVLQNLLKLDCIQLFLALEACSFSSSLP